MSSPNHLSLYQSFDWTTSAMTGDYKTWNGSAEQAIAELSPLITDNRHDPEVIWHPSRLVSAVVKSSTEGQPRVDSINYLVDFTQRLFKGDAAVGDLDDITEIADTYGILQKNIRQKIDKDTVRATNPGHSYKAAARLHNKYPCDNILMIPLLGGGFTAGIMTAIAYQEITGRDPSLYPIYYSAQTAGDKAPRMTTEERRHIGEQALAKTIVVFDEDSSTGITVGSATASFRDLLPSHNITGLVNQDRRRPLLVSQQGEWWENPQYNYESDRGLAF